MENNIENSKVLLSASTDAERVAFYKKTYTHVAGGVLLFVIFEYLLLQSTAIVEFALSMTQGFKWLLLLGGFMLVTNYAESTMLKTQDKSKQYAAYGVYILAEAFIFIPLIYIAMLYTGSADLLQQAAIVTLALFAGISSIVFITKKDFSFLKSALTVGFFIAIGLIIAGTLFGFSLGLWFSVGMCILAGGSILYQTSNLVNKYSTNDYIPAALGLFASLMLLFWYVLQLFLSRD
ncbi:Bax inhibitor-1/YccA family protein [Tenacibaculum maritimum]|uniref:Transmembrane protein n=1 Tax=Tenacibaculum maritimum NCIMB 2154 TaxID=1349785 RepID=A0A2H1EDU6_9FLAO|nr:Bax inhibitor-1 family protein [Tenacibaculum maritimum]MCD9562122.1 Bax inhibitor-1 family protein [Tenacibaculum maritimum]MCD9565641.1 Bax inhibitor-1 family protein [Tenacibaculum maritimum]MCD9578510.1 Bax inhibitor-1 family protein [Tenacibaculum maritimum]MCD9581110.1 Bax inhibitor-1 family protein [Tenacibaculum maritimum]MCD9596433.1 Bax inhibitor-1 family protein [Tenacibaculum maritimum]